MLFLAVGLVYVAFLANLTCHFINTDKAKEVYEIKKNTEKYHSCCSSDIRKRSKEILYYLFFKLKESKDLRI